MTFSAPGPAAYRAQIEALPEDLLMEDIVNRRFRIGQEGRLAVYYAPLDWINHSARIVFVGLTPGWTQTKSAFERFRHALRDGQCEDEALKAAKRQAAFRGMRRRLCDWLDKLRVQEWLHISGTDELFGVQDKLLHTTSAIRYPVFVGDNATNYTGHRPAPVDSPLLISIIGSVLLPELDSLPEALVVPMGRPVSEALRSKGFDASRCLFGFPHPSGANAHGARQFAEEQAGMRKVVERLPEVRATS